MKYIIEPLNENGEMNCVLRFSGDKSAAVKKATGIAAALQSQLDGASITCRVRSSQQNLEDSGGIVVTPAGQALDAESGNAVKL